jgi:MFS family permease
LFDSSRSRIRRLAASRLISITGGEAAAVALAFTIYSRTGSALWHSASLLFTFGVAGLISPVAGSIGDRFDRRRAMIACELLGAAAYTGLVFVRAPATMIAIGFVAEMARAPFEPASAAAIPNLAGEQDLKWANSLVATGSRIGGLLGPAVGGLLVAAGGSSLAFGLNAVSFVISAALIATVRGRFSAKDDQEGTEYEGALAGFRFVLRDRFLRSLAIAWAITWFAANIVVVADVPLAKAFGVGAFGLGLIYTFDSAGGIVGSFAARRVPPSADRIALLSDMVALAVAYSIVSVSPWFALVLIAVAVGLGFDSLAAVVGTTIVQHQTPDAIRARVFAAIGGMGMAANVVAFSVAGFLVDLVGPRGVYLVGAGAAAIAGVVLLPALRQMRSPDPGGEESPNPP